MQPVSVPVSVPRPLPVSPALPYVLHGTFRRNFPLWDQLLVGVKGHGSFWGWSHQKGAEQLPTYAPFNNDNGGAAELEVRKSLAKDMGVPAVGWWEGLHPSRPGARGCGLEAVGVTHIERRRSASHSLNLAFHLETKTRGHQTVAMGLRGKAERTPSGHAAWLALFALHQRVTSHDGWSPRSGRGRRRRCRRRS